ncbi:UDP-4-amino-4,6-dideoxy-N-acetyl-beta-L-altrosamine transaminase [Salimicrobium halophilum]|uniref:UDP-4-amino-4,6-dideoxy-N-acetyl-beta-L-altrosamine transaminase n=1 Tax=Salimicrobium halophilum TaxID=86666 RepID=A0A1G8V2S2_9BACI|nr:UDP-4-amino-4,6-dideoxy-N-acetyl-beta-L-altrosamine transaminase [Salimicrobium halophilum]SDJ60331.1 UDP-4-amino-4,6-dideoxy-N-acetyl-beta-L-altrosamine transaminase [Salimicrobium halophilum]
MVNRDTFLPYGQQWLEEDDIQAVIDVLRSDYITTGPAVKQFEEDVASYVDAEYAVAFSNGTAALHAACFAADIYEGDEVITSPMTFVASSNCVLYQGGTPVFADINPQTYNIDPIEVRKKITKDTKAIIPVDFTGQPIDIETIRTIAEDYNLIIIEDAAHAIGATYKNEKVGSLSDMTMFSFHPVKHVTTGEGGVITTDNPTYYKKLLHFRSHGITRDKNDLENNSQGDWYYEMQELGYNYRMTDIQAALGSSQLKKLDAFIGRRREIVKQYKEAFEGVEGLQTPYQAENSHSSWHLYVLRFNQEIVSLSRKEIFEQLKKRNIGVNVHYIPVHLQPYYQQLGWEKGMFPVAEQLYEEIITLPLFPKMSDEDVKDVINAVFDVLGLEMRDGR